MGRVSRRRKRYNIHLHITQTKGGRIASTDKILITDDESKTLNLAKLILEKKGYKVVTASNGDETIANAETEIPDLILLDVVMPGKSGFEICRILKSQAKTRHIPIIMFTVLTRDVDKEISRDVGADGYFAKPFTPQDLQEEVKSQLEKDRESKFSKQLNTEHNKIKGKKFILEFEPSTSYDKVVRDFALESTYHNERVVVLTQKGSVIQQILEDENIELFKINTQIIMSSILEKQPDKPVSLIFDSLTDISLSEGFQIAYNFTRNMLELTSSPKTTGLFLLNTHAHEEREVKSLKALFSHQLAYEKSGMIKIRF